mmetsp:Transcript_87288/g.271129  ORF Transcript_87288/g.271129 Transcript_87288/m.271129 type:complete len:370 (+) Transcript_87288:77-1186(+)
MPRPWILVQLAGAVSSGAVPAADLLVPCWDGSSGVTSAECCTEPRHGGAYGRCFDSIFTYEECCLPAGRGGARARRSPDALPEPLRAPGASRRSHPSFSRAQRSFETRHAASSTVMEHSWPSRSGAEVKMRMHLFKRSVMISDNLVQSLQEYFETFRDYLAQAGTAEEMVFLDIGASVGIFAVALALEFPAARILAVEPAPQNYRYLLWNIRENNLTGRVWAVNAAMKGPGGPDVLPLQYSPIWPISTMYCPMDKDSECEFYSYSVPALDFAALLKLLGLKHLTWLKVDCEGCEWHLAADPAFLLALLADVNLVTVEFHVSESLSHEAAGAAVRAVCPPGPGRDELLQRLAPRPRWALACSRRLGPRTG